jgi:Mg-chelatase subunit ChlD
VIAPPPTSLAAPLAVVEHGPVRWTSAPAAWVVVLLVVGTWLAVRAFYGRERAKAPASVRALLALLRVATLVVLFLALFGPYREEIHKAEDKGHVVLLLDTSASMKTVDRYAAENERRILEAAWPEGGPGARPSSLTASRLELAQRLLAGPGEPFLRALSERFVVHAFAFDEDARSIATTDPARPAARDGEPAAGDADLAAAVARAVRGIESPTGGRTRIGAALRSIAREFVGREDRRLAGVVLVTDGKDNGEEAEKPAEALAALGKAAEELRVFAVALGDPGSGKDLKVDRIVAKDVVLVMDEVSFRAELRHQGFSGARGVRVAMTVDQVAGPDGAPLPAPVPWKPRPSSTQTLEKSVDLLDAQRPTPVALRAQFHQAGTFDVRIRATLPKDLQEQDAIRENDVLVHRLLVRDQTIKVLLADYNLRHESWFLKNLLVRESRGQDDPRRLDAQVFIQSFDADVEQPHGRDSPPLRAFPSTRKEIFEYHVIILGDIHWRSLGKTEEQSKEILRHLKEFVTEGGGIAFVAGEDRNPKTFSDTPLQDLVPVFVRPSDPSADTATREPFRLTPTDVGAQHPILTVVPDATPEAVERLWRERDGWEWYWMYRATGGLKPGAFALARVYGVTGDAFRDERREPLPVFAAMPVGKGRVFFSAIDSISRIRREARDQYYGAFWDETIRWLATYRLQSGNKRFTILTDKESYFVNDKATITVAAYDQDFQPLRGAFRDLQVEDPRGRPMLTAAPQDQPRPDPESPGLYRTEVRLPQSGTYRITVGPPARDRAEKSVTARFATKEDQDTIPDHETLREAANRGNPAQTGRVYAPWEVPGLPAKIPARTTERVLDREEIPLWDTVWTLVLATVLLGVEWVLRKRYQMI